MRAGVIECAVIPDTRFTRSSPPVERRSWLPMAASALATIVFLRLLDTWSRPAMFVVAGVLLTALVVRFSILVAKELGASERPRR